MEESVEKRFEELETQLGELKDLQLSNKLSLVELREELEDLKQGEKSGEEIPEKGVKRDFVGLESRINELERKLDKIEKQAKQRKPKPVKKEVKREESKEEKKVKEKGKKEDNVCEKCGMKNEKGAKYCVVCGNELSS